MWSSDHTLMCPCALLFQQVYNSFQSKNFYFLIQIDKVHSCQGIKENWILKWVYQMWTNLCWIRIISAVWTSRKEVSLLWHIAQHRTFNYSQHIDFLHQVFQTRKVIRCFLQDFWFLCRRLKRGMDQWLSLIDIQFLILQFS